MARPTSPRDDSAEILFPDAGLNSSAAWTEHNMDVASITSNEVPLMASLDMDWAPAIGKPARAIQNFSGDPNSSEL